MSEPIPVRVTRYHCPHCTRSGSSKSRVREHMARCWRNPDARGCLTCAHFAPAEDDRCDAPNGCGACGFNPERCAAGVDLSGRRACKACHGVGQTFDAGTLGVSECQDCGGDAAEVKPGPIVGCEKWEKQR